MSKPSTLLARMEAKVDRRGPDDCWPYSGATQGGYGVISDRPLSRKAHRVAYELWVGPIPDGATLDHECHNRALLRGECSPGECEHRRCCNPAHLVPRPLGENTLRGGSFTAENSRKTHCIRGHLLPEDRLCRECQRIYRERYWARKRAEKYPNWIKGETCTQGHPFAEFGYLRKDGHYNCRKCAAENARRYRSKK